MRIAQWFVCLLAVAAAGNASAQTISFNARRDVAAGSGPISVAVADLNGDGISDLAVANQASNNVSVILGNGDGTFQAPLSFAVSATPRAVAIGDFNGDGLLDLAVANQGSNDISVLLGDGDGHVPSRAHLPGGHRAVSRSGRRFQRRRRG
jgi:hypothetical protein